MTEITKDKLPFLCAVSVCITRSEEEMLKFMAGQNSIWGICGRDVLSAFDLSPFRQICDLGGECQIFNKPLNCLLLQAP